MVIYVSKGKYAAVNLIEDFRSMGVLYHEQHLILLRTVQDMDNSPMFMH